MEQCVSWIIDLGMKRRVHSFTKQCYILGVSKKAFYYILLIVWNVLVHLDNGGYCYANVCQLLDI